MKILWAVVPEYLKAGQKNPRDENTRVQQWKHEGIEVKARL